MKSLLLKIERYWKRTAKDWKVDSTFSKRYACYRVVDQFFGKLGLRKISDIAYKRREKFILDYLQRKLKAIIEKYKNDDCLGEKVVNAPIWICWWSGLENAPELVKQCVKSTIKCARKHPVYLITKENYEEYITIPTYMLQKVEKGQMGFAHLADYIRVCLIEKYGGLWMDATLFCTGDISEEYFDMPFFTLKSPWRESRYLSHFQWTTFCLGGWKGNVWYSFMKEAFECYWKSEDFAIDYLFFDALIFLAKNNIKIVEQLMEQVPESTPHRDDLQAAMNQGFPATEFWNVIKKDTAIYKLSWREKYSTRTQKGEKSIYQYFLEYDFKQR